MKARGYTLGGEQSGHVIMSDHATTGDGILTALQVLERMAATGQSLAELAGVMTRLPQVLVNVPGVDKARADDDAVLAAAVAEAEAELGETGRVLLRPSGTEPLVRVMVEAPHRRDRRRRRRPARRRGTRAARSRSPDRRASTPVAAPIGVALASCPWRYTSVDPFDDGRADGALARRLRPLAAPWPRAPSTRGTLRRGPLAELREPATAGVGTVAFAAPSTASRGRAR